MNTDSLEARIYSAFPIIKIESDEEPRLLEQLREISRQTAKALLTWSAASGLQSLEAARSEQGYPVAWAIKGEADSDSQCPEALFEELAKGTRNTIIVLLDFHPYLTNPRVTRLLKELAFDCENTKNKVILISHSITIPDEIARLTQPFEVTLPSVTDIANLVDQEATLFKIKRKDKTLVIDETAKSLLINNMVGVNTSDALRLIRNAIYVDNAITASDIPEIKKAKYDLISHSGALTYEYDTSSFGKIGGFKNLKAWVAKRQNAILSKSTDVAKSNDRPKGILLLGVQGCGKSLAARALSGQLGVPLIRLDFGSLFNKYVGESEKNLREALHSAQVMSPCVLWIDELEKSITTGSDDTGASSRILSYLLNWMQENRSGTFVVATANDITALPPELIRKGRIDEIFFVDLPTRSIRIEILRSVLLKRGIDLESFDLPRIATVCKGFSGAEIEQAVVASLYQTEYVGAPPGAEAIMHEMRQTQPLSVVRAESIAALRHWAADRTVPVDDADESDVDDEVVSNHAAYNFYRSNG